MGAFKLKNPDPASPYKDGKYSYSEDLYSLYLLTGDETLLPSIADINPFLKLAIYNLGWTERFAAYGLSAAAIDYIVNGRPEALAEAQRIIDDLLVRQARHGSDGSPNPGCIIGNNEWGADGFSPWMAPMLLAQVLRYYEATGDGRVPGLIAQIRCVVLLHEVWLFRMEPAVLSLQVI